MKARITVTLKTGVLDPQGKAIEGALRPLAIPASITPDGRWIAFNYRTVLGHIYRSDTLK